MFLIILLHKQISMKNNIALLILLLLQTFNVFSQSIDNDFSQKKMKKDLEVFKSIRLKANSGLYKHRTEKEIDSIYNWAEIQIEKSRSYRDFYNIICRLSDFEGSTHNSISFPTKKSNTLKLESEGYFPYPLKLINQKWILNFTTDAIPLGSEIVSINNLKTTEIIFQLYKYYETDGKNITGKRIGIEYNFSKYYRFNYGLKKSFDVVYKIPDSDKELKINLTSIGFKEYYKNVKLRYSNSFDILDYTNYLDLKEVYTYKNINNNTGVLTINSFAIGENANSPQHLKFVKFLDSTFSDIKLKNIKNLIVDVRHNGGGSDPNDLVAYEYLTNRNFSENKSAWISFKKIPYLRYIDTKVPTFLRFLGVSKYNRYFRKEFPKEMDGKFYQDETSEDHKIRTPNANAFNGKIYLLISSRVASAGSNFAALVASNDTTTIVGEETQGGYYGHNGHTPMNYILPKSKLNTQFSVVNLEQFVIEKPSQPKHRGIMPNYNISQSFIDYLNHTDTQMNYVMELINKTN